MNNNKLEISSRFSINDIHKIREYNYEITKDMTFNERMNYYEKEADEVLKLMAERRKAKFAASQNKEEAGIYE